MDTQKFPIDSLWQQASQSFGEKQYDQAISYCQGILTQHPHYLPALELLGMSVGKQGNHLLAGQCFSQCIDHKPDNPAYYYNLALSQFKTNCIDTALQTLQKSLQCNLTSPDFPSNELSNIYYKIAQQLHQYESYNLAVNAYEKSLSLQKDNTQSLLGLGAAWHALRQPEKAILIYNQLLSITPLPEAHGNRAQSLLLAGRLEEGFAEYEWRIRIPEFAPIFAWFQQKPCWQGESFSGKTLLIHDEQGFGDAFQFIRYAAMVKKRGGTVVVSAKKSALDILAAAPGVDSVVEHTEEALTALHFDLSIPLMSLPHIFGTTLRTIPCPIPYLLPSEEHRLHWQPHLKKIRNLRVGLVWAGNPKHSHGLNRTCRLQSVLPLLQLPHIRFFSLQVGEASKELLQLPAKIRPTDFSSEIKDFTDTAAIIHHLDLVVSVDTAVAHLAGAMGKKVFLLLPFANEWRWLTQGEKSPWYPSMTLFRQPMPQNWVLPIEEISKQLQLLAEKHRATSN